MIAIVPLVSYLSGFLTSTLVPFITKRTNNHFLYIIGVSFVLSSSGWAYSIANPISSVGINSSQKYHVIGIAMFSGIGKGFRPYMRLLWLLWSNQIKVLHRCWYHRLRWQRIWLERIHQQQHLFMVQWVWQIRLQMELLSLSVSNFSPKIMLIDLKFLNLSKIRGNVLIHANQSKCSFVPFKYQRNILKWPVLPPKELYIIPNDQ